MRGRVVVATALGVLLAGCSASTDTTSSAVASFNARPVLCYAPPLTPSSAPLASRDLPPPTCAPQYQLTAASLHVQINTSTYAGYTSNLQTSADPQFAAYPSTPKVLDVPSREVLLPGAPTNGTKVRYVLGPASLTRASVKTALAYDEAGVWVDNVVLTSKGSVAWDALAKSQFHALVAFVVNGEVLVASLIQPTQSSYSSSEGVIQISAGLTEQQTKTVAAELS